MWHIALDDGSQDWIPLGSPDICAVGEPSPPVSPLSPFPLPVHHHPALSLTPHRQRSRRLRQLRRAKRLRRLRRAKPHTASPQLQMCLLLMVTMMVLEPAGGQHPAGPPTPLPAPEECPGDCERKYVAALINVFPNGTRELGLGNFTNYALRALCGQELLGAEGRGQDSITVQTHQRKIFGIGPGSSGTRSLFYALAMLNVTGLHFGSHFSGCSFNHDIRPDAAARDPNMILRREDVDFWGDTPVPSMWPQLLHRAPNYRVIMTDLDSDRWLMNRRSFRKGFCFCGRPLSSTSCTDTEFNRRSGRFSHCTVPMAFTPPPESDSRDSRGSRQSRQPQSGNGWMFLLVHHATREETAGAFKALREFVRCRVPPDRRLWLDFSSGPQQRDFWPRLTSFVGHDLPGSVSSAIGESFPHSNDKSCTIGSADCNDVTGRLFSGAGSCPPPPAPIRLSHHTPHHGGG